jgi:raffinose/stachyose/melibiose transport system substrate-binding protein
MKERKGERSMKGKFNPRLTHMLGRILIIVAIVLLGSAATKAGTAKAAGATVTIESWRTEDTDMWDNIIADFNKTHADITVKFQPTKNDQYNGAVQAKLDSGTAGDIITCRPFTNTLDKWKKGQLADLTKLPGMENFSTFAKHAWSTPDDKTTFCVPMASVLHGFIYNKDYFDKNGFKEPATYEDFLALLDKIKAKGDITPLALGVKDGWAEQTMGFDNIGPNFWGGQDAVDGLLTGKNKYNDPGFLAAYTALSKWTPYLGTGYEAETYPDSQTLFTSGKAAIFPAGSWEISGFEQNASFKMGAFKAPPPAGAKQCYVSNQIDIAMGLNAASKNQDAAKTFLSYAASQQFETLYSQGLPGFFPLGTFKITLSDPLANTFLGWTQQCASTLRSSDQIPNPPKTAGVPDVETDGWNTNAQLLGGKLTPQQAADQIQKDFESWYKPGAS